MRISENNGVKKLIFFPNPYNDELLYSVLARYHSYSGNENPKTTMDELFGSNLVSASVVLPAHLNALSERLPTPKAYSSNYFVYQHTLLPYFSPFLPPKRLVALKNLMINSNGKTLHMLLGRTASNLSNPVYLKYCKKCITVEQKQNGEAYWHRTHQVNGVELCPQHHILLSESDIPYSLKRNKHELVSINKSISKDELKTDSLNQYLGFDNLKFIAEQSYYLLNNQIEPLGMENITSFYVGKLRKKKLVTVSGRIRWSELVSLFNKFYGEDLLRKMNCYIEINKKDTWLHKLLRKPRVSCHPLRHILILGFLGETISSLVGQINESNYEPFGKNPWPCLNKASNHYKTKIITSCVVTRDYKTGLPIGTFTCSCGFVYSRKGPDKSHDDIYKIGRIKLFGPVWEQKLLQLAKLDISLRKKANMLGVDPKTVKNKLNSNINNEKDLIIEDKSIQYREQWMKLVLANNDKSLTEVRELNSKLYMWLYRNDKEWLGRNSPKNKKKFSYNLSKRIDWELRDKENTVKVELIVNEILQEVEAKKIIRVTKNEIGRRLGKPSYLKKGNLDKMPRLKKVVEEKIETVEQFQMRRIKYIAASLRETRASIKEWEIIRVAGLKKHFIYKHENLIKQEASTI